MNIFADNYYVFSKDILADSAVTTLDFGTIELEKLPQSKISLAYELSLAVIAGENSKINTVKNVEGLNFKLYNRTKNCEITTYSFQNDAIVFEKGTVSAYDVIEIEAWTDSYAKITKTVMLDDVCTAHTVLTFKENGKIKYNASVSDIVLYIFDQDGKLVEKHNATGETIITSAFADGAYQVVLMKKTDAITNVSLLENLKKFGLNQNADYLLKNVTVRSGEISVIEKLKVPDLDPSKFEYTVPESTIFTTNYTTVAVGRYISMRAQYQLSDKVVSPSGEYVTFILPENLVFMEGSVTLDGKVCAYIKEGNTIKVNVGEASGTIRLYVMADSAADAVVEAYVGFVSQSIDFVQPIGTASVQVSNATISMPQKTGRKNIYLNGNAVAESIVEIYCDGTKVGETVANKVGKWTAPLTLPNPAALDSFEVYAVITTPKDVVYQTSVQTLTYDENYAEVERVTMINTCGIEYTTVFEFLVPDDGRHAFTWGPSSPDFTFIVEMTGDNVGAVQVVTLNSADEETYVTCKYDAASGNWIGTHAYKTSYSVPMGLYVLFVPKANTGYIEANGSSNASNAVEDHAYIAPTTQNVTKPNDSMQLSVNKVAPDKGGLGTVTLCLEGKLLEPNAQIKLTNGTKESLATTVYWINHKTVYATFDTAELTDGKYDIVVICGQNKTTLEKGFTVDSSLTKGNISYEFHIDDSIKTGTLVKGYLTATNTGNTDVFAPVLAISGNNVLLGADEKDLAEDQIVFLQNYEGLAGTLAPGQIGVYNFVYKANADGTFSFELIDFNSVDDSLANRVVLNGESSESEIFFYYAYSMMGASYKEYAKNMAKMANALTGEKAIITLQDLEYAYIQNVMRLFGGDKIDSVIDLSSESLCVIRSYINPLFEAKVGMFGTSWRSQYEIIAEYENEDGSEQIALWFDEIPVTYRKNNDGIFVSTNPSDGQITRAASGEMTLTTLSGVIYKFNADGQVVSVTDLNGNKVTLIYLGGKLNTIESSSGDRLVLSYKDGKVSEIVSATTGDKVNYEYDGDRLIKVKTAYGDIVYTYSSVSLEKTYDRLNKITYPDGTYVTYSYDQYGRVSQLSNGQMTVFYEYGLNEIILSDNLGNKATYRYNANGEVRWVMDDKGDVVYYAYNENGEQISASYGLLYTSEVEYDANGNPVKSIRPDGSVVSYKYDKYGNIVSITDSNNAETKYERDEKGNITAIVYPDGTKESYTYDENGNILTYTKRSGVTVTYTYDARNNVTKMVYSTGEVLEYTYDNFSNVTSITENGVKTELKYSANGALTEVIYPDSKKVTYAYDSLGRIISVTDADGFVTGYTYNAEGYLESVTDGTNALVTYTYNTDGTLKRQTNANGTYTDYTYANGMLGSITNYNASGTVISSIAYIYDSLGYISSMTDCSGTWYYTYDRLGQLIGTVAPDGTTTQYAYDGAGNRTKVTVNGKDAVYSSNELNQYTTYGNVTREYDADGNLIKEIAEQGTATYEWDYQGRLVKYTAHDGTVYEYGYDAFGLRNKVTVNGVTTTYLNDPMGYGFALAEYGANGTTHYNVAGGIVASQNGGNTYYYNANHLGSVTEITDKSGAVVNKYLYNQEGDVIQKTEGISNPFTYVGIYGIINDGNGLIYDRARYVSTATDSFISVDPLGQNADLNTYRYALNNAIINCDFSGFAATSPIIKKGVKEIIKKFPKPKSTLDKVNETGDLITKDIQQNIEADLIKDAYKNHAVDLTVDLISIGLDISALAAGGMTGVGAAWATGMLIYDIGETVIDLRELIEDLMPPPPDPNKPNNPSAPDNPNLPDGPNGDGDKLPEPPCNHQSGCKCGNCAKCGKKPEGQIDPSGYVYEGVTSNRLEGVKVTIYYEGYKLDEFGEIDYEAGPQMFEWTDAADYGETNPQLTDILGRYGWDVLPGKWIVKYEKDGYAVAWSEWMVVPPEYTDVNINLQTLTAPMVSSVTAYSDYILIEFSQYMDMTTVNTSNITVMLGGKAVTGTIIPVNADYNFEKTAQYASIFKFVPDTALTEDADVTVSVANVKNYANIVMENADSKTVKVLVEPKSIDVSDQVLVNYLESQEFVIQINPANVGAGVKINVESLSLSRLSVLTKTLVTDSDGKVVCKVKGLLPGRCDLVITVEGTSLMKTVVCVIGDVDSEFDACSDVVTNITSGTTVDAGTEIVLTTETEDAEIYYTLDGSDPCDAANPNRIKYEKPIALEADTIIKAYAVKDGMYDSDVAEFSYRVKKHTIKEGWQSDENGHWHACNDCNEKRDEAKHTFDDANKCTVCGFAKGPDEDQDHSGENDQPGVGEHPGNTDVTQDELPTYVVVIITVGAVLAIEAIAFSIYWFVIRKKRKNK